MKVKTSELIDLVLDWAVAKAVGINADISHDFGTNHPCEIFDSTAAGKFSPSSNWSQCGPLVNEYWIDLFQEGTDENFIWYAKTPHLMGESECGDTPQIAICRAVVASLLGDEIELPEGLANGLD